MSETLRRVWIRVMLRPSWFALQRKRGGQLASSPCRLRSVRFSSAASPEQSTRSQGTEASTREGRSSTTPLNQRAWLWYAGLIVPSLGLGGVLIEMHRDATFRAQVERVLPGSTRWLSQLTGRQYKTPENHVKEVENQQEMPPDPEPPLNKLPASSTSLNEALIQTPEEPVHEGPRTEEQSSSPLPVGSIAEKIDSETTTPIQDAATSVLSFAKMKHHSLKRLSNALSTEPLEVDPSTAPVRSSSGVATTEEHRATSSAEIRALAEQLGTLVVLEALRIRDLIEPLEATTTPATTAERPVDDTEKRRKVALKLLEQEQTFRQDLERYLQRLQMLLRRELEPNLDAQRLVLKREQMDRLLELQLLLERVEARALRDRAYKQYTHWAHRTALLWQALGERLTRGEPFATELAASWVRSAALVQHVLTCLSPSIAARGVTTAASLQERFLHQDTSGVWGYWLARLAAWLKTSRLEENLDGVFTAQMASNACNATEEDQKMAFTTEQRLLWARFCVERGDLGQALEHLQQIPADSLVSRLCRDWITDVEQYLRLEQAVRVIRAESTSITAALV
ncbi:hypothetical protein F1559_001180 [Cyanidiococcus yangmingshanensis]|uniref:Uncharacterized protein n=1 Tax=Cyanidiococcus yangmingshanensis TaxID=2690220 RepID=A0A7J7IJ01_9RHOD|nr:hypothetical protein F1559_001180 [Cyanidiococcus yangmingshanensis]